MGQYFRSGVVRTIRVPVIHLTHLRPAFSIQVSVNRPEGTTADFPLPLSSRDIPGNNGSTSVHVNRHPAADKLLILIDFVFDLSQPLALFHKASIRVRVFKCLRKQQTESLGIIPPAATILTGYQLQPTGKIMEPIPDKECKVPRSERLLMVTC